MGPVRDPEAVGIPDDEDRELGIAGQRSTDVGVMIGVRCRLLAAVEVILFEVPHQDRPEVVAIRGIVMKVAHLPGTSIIPELLLPPAGRV